MNIVNNATAVAAHLLSDLTLPAVFADNGDAVSEPRALELFVRQGGYAHSNIRPSRPHQR